MNITVPEVPRKWRKSSRSGQDTDCVELRPDAIRDSKNPDGGIIALPIGALIAAVKADTLTR